MPDGPRIRQRSTIESGVKEISLDVGISSKERGASRLHNLRDGSRATSLPSPRDSDMNSASHSPVKNGHASGMATPATDHPEEEVGGQVTVSIEPGQPPKLSRSVSQKIVARSPTLFTDHADKIAEAQQHFGIIPACTYANKYIGSTEHGSMDCDCAEEWDGVARVNAACGDDSDCINRATKMECVGDCGCGADCQNQRFQRKLFAPVTVFKTEKKGYGLRADSDLSPDDFVYEYIGEVIGEQLFRKRMVQYDEEGIKHFYFMSLIQGEFVDATKKGNLGRFCNHSCNPNCFVDKWVVGDKLRMGIFAERKIKAGEELTFNYNVDRYGADPQPCYCGEPNCTGFIGGKTQTERATKLSHTTIEALGIDDGDGWDTAVAKKPRKKKANEDDEEFVNNVQPKSLDEHGVTKVMATLMQCKEKWISVKLLGRIQHSDDERVRNRVVKMHGYQILNSNLLLWKDDPNIVLQIFDILDNFPRLTRNKISDSKIETTVDDLKSTSDERVASKADHLLREWATLEVAYRIPRKKRELDTTATPDKASRSTRRESREERKGRSRSRSREGSRSSSKSMEIPKGPSAVPSGPRNSFPQRQPGYFAGPRPPFRPRVAELPVGWFHARDEAGRIYYYNTLGGTTWERPTAAVPTPGPPPPRTSTNQALEAIINEITSAKTTTSTEKGSTIASTPAANGVPKKIGGEGKEKWRSLPVDKQMKLYENTIYPHVKYVMDKFKGKLPKDDLKRFAKEISKKLVSSDFKNNRVEDPTKMNSKKEKQVKAYVKDFFDKAAKKHKEREHRRAERKAKQATANASSAGAVAAEVRKEEDEESDGDQDMAISDDEEATRLVVESNTPSTPLDQISLADGLKRKREILEGADCGILEDPESTPSKVLKSDTPPPPPPPPPAPPIEAYPSPMLLSPGTLEGTESPGYSRLSKLSEDVEPSPESASAVN